MTPQSSPQARLLARLRAEITAARSCGLVRHLEAA